MTAPLHTRSRAPFTMLRFSTIPCLLAALVVMTGSDLRAQSVNKTVEAVERHYNRLSALTMGFEQSMEYAGRTRSSERGTLYLLRPGKMRWEYSDPEGKIAISDGKIFRMYNPKTNQVRQVHLEAMTDLRAPLSFLLGRMRLRRMFRNLRLEQVGEQQILIGEGRGGRDVYSRVEFTLGAEDHRITGIRIVGRDESVNSYRFSDEESNPTLSAAMFEFQAPAGAEVVPLTRGFNEVPFESQ